MKRLYWHLLYGAAIAFGGLAVLMLLARFGMYSDVMMLIFFAGSVGAVVNNYFRLSKMIEAKAAPADDAQERLAIIQMYVSMLIAGILAFVAYGLFLSGLLQGSLFPEFEHTKDIYKDVTSMLVCLAPKTNIDAAKSLLWAFVAGFSERFVPNIIDTLVSKAKSDG